MTAESHYLRGAFAIFDSEDVLQGRPQFLVFRFNPETLSRSFEMSPGAGEPGILGQGRASGPRVVPGWGPMQAADAASGPSRERLSVQLRFDFADRHLAARVLPPQLGIAPEIAALELMVQPVEDPLKQAAKPVADALRKMVRSRSEEPLMARPRMPTVLFIWGRLRILPVRITSLSINETLFNAELNPLRAEAEVGLEVISGDESNSPMVTRALSFMNQKRFALARLFHVSSVAQGSYILPL